MLRLLKVAFSSREATVAGSSGIWLLHFVIPRSRTLGSLRADSDVESFLRCAVPHIPSLRHIYLAIAHRSNMVKKRKVAQVATSAQDLGVRTTSPSEKSRLLYCTTALCTTRCDFHVAPPPAFF